MITSVTPFQCSTIPHLEGKLVIEYARDGKKYTRFAEELFGIDPNTGKPRFELVPDRHAIDETFSELRVLLGKSEGSAE